MQLTVLGCSGTIPGPASPASGYLVEHDGFRVVLDLGPGALGALQGFIRPEQIDVVILSHLHPDHFLDLTGLATYLRWSPGYPYRRVPVIGPAETQARLDAAYADAGAPSGMGSLFDFQLPVAAALGPFEVSYARTRHPITCHAVRLEAGGRSLVYTGDTGPSSSLVDFTRDADVLLCEASFGLDETFIPDLHMTGRQAGGHAAAADVGRLIVTHVPPWNSAASAVSEAATTFAGPVFAAEQGASYEI